MLLVGIQNILFVITNTGEPKLIEIKPYEPLDAAHPAGIVERETKFKTKEVCLESTIETES